MYVWCHQRSAPTGRKLAAVLGLPARQRDPFRGRDILLRWGNPQRPELTTVIQPAAAIARAGNKLVALRTMRDAGVPVPDYTTEQPNDVDVWLGRSLNGFGGRDIKLPGDPAWTNVSFWTKYIPNRREYRIHVVNGNVIRVQRKYLDFPEQHDNHYVQNYAQGYRFRTPAQRLHQNRLDAATGAVAALGLDFGAVDLLVGQDNNPYVLEVNTAPKLAPLTARQYAGALVSLAADRGFTITINDAAFAAFGGVNE